MVSLFTAFLAAAMVQRVLLGQYGFTLRPLTVPEITAEQMREAAESTLAGVPADAKVERVAAPEPVWATVDDPNLALAGWRIDLERELRRIADEYHLPDTERRGVGQLLVQLSQSDIVNRDTVPGLQGLLSLANRGVHGASVDPSVIEVLRTEGRSVLQYLSSIRG
jgi:hypothetical protein